MTKIVNNWNEKYSKELQEHYKQNEAISNDFLKALPKTSLLYSFENYVEFGCGTGNLTKKISEFNNVKSIVGYDISSIALNFATENNSNKKCIYLNFDIISCTYSENICDCIITSNTLEHFKNPNDVINKLLSLSKYVAIIVPFNAPKDRLAKIEDDNGGLYHNASFNEYSFDEYNIVEIFTFKTDGWKEGLQLYVLLTKKD